MTNTFNLTFVDEYELPLTWGDVVTVPALANPVPNFYTLTFRIEASKKKGMYSY